MDLAGLVIESGVRSLAVVGTAKNVGKTVTMNYLASELYARGICVGLVSSGRDGETTDSFTGEPKPSITPPEGSWVATAEGVIGSSGGFMEIADVSENAGLLGRLVLGRVREPSPVELVGPQNAVELASVVKRLRSLGAQVVLVDGALDRAAAASPRVTDAAILATGASAGTNLAEIAETAGRVAWLWSRRPPAGLQVRELAKRAIREGTVTFLDGNQIDRYIIRKTSYRSVLGSEEDILSQAGSAAYVIVPGAVTQTFLSYAAEWPERDDFTVIARDPVSVFMDSYPDVGLLVAEPVNLLAVTTNPVSHTGMSYEPDEMVGEVSGEVSRRTGRRVPVFDVVSGETSSREVAGLAMG